MKTEIKRLSIILLIVLCVNLNVKAGGFWQSLWNGISSPFRPVWGSYKVSGQNNSAPIALFKRTTFEKDKKDIIDRIKIEKSDFAKIYFRVYEKATNNYTYTIPASSGAAQTYENRATFAKNAAFVLVLGVNEIGDALTQTQKDALAANVLSVIKTADDVMNDDWFKKSTDLLDGGWGQETQLIRSVELTNYCIALDLFRTAGYSWNNDRDNNDNPKTALKYITRKLYRFADRPFNTLSSLLNNNLTIITSSAITLSAVVNCDETDYFFKPNRQPDNWARKGHTRIRTTEFTDLINSQSRKGDKYGHDEGPGYYAKAMKEGLMPMAVAFDNFVGNNDAFSERMLFQTISNYFYDPDWQNTFYWFRDIMQPNGFCPSYNDTRISTSLPSLACTKDPKLSLLEGINLMNSFSDTYDDRSDFLAANNPCVPFERTVNFVNTASGDAVFRTPITTEENEQHYIHINLNGPDGMFEELKAQLVDWILDGADHTHPSAGNIIINAGNEILLMDAPYYGYENKNNINEGKMHNVISVNDIGPIRTDNPEVLSQNPVLQNIKVATKYEGPNPDAKVTREVQAYNFIDQNDHLRYYYEVIDDFKPALDLGFQMQGNTYKLNLNGNGSLEDNTCNDSRKSSGQVVWSYPCEARGTWKLYARTSLSSPWPDVISFDVADTYKNGNSNFQEFINYNNLINAKIASGAVTATGTSQGEGSYSKHATFTASVYCEKGVFQTILIPLKCDEPDFPVDSFWVKSKTDSFYSVSTLKDLGKDFISNIHIKKGFAQIDTIRIENSLFNNSFGQLSHIKFIGNRGLLSISRDSVFRRKNCIAFTKFRRASFNSGSLLQMNDTNYIKSTKLCDANYQIIGPSKYECQVKTDSLNTLSFFLAGMERGIDMKVDGFTFSYDTGTCIMSVDVPGGFSQFEIELADPCLVSCFFPSTAETIDETFEFNEGITATLGHKLDIVQPNGFLHISKGSHMQICNGVYLRNRDSLIVFSGCGKDTGQLNITTCDGKAIGVPYATMSGAGGGAKSSKISVMDGAALILDESSFTQISNNSELHVWGSLVIKNTAKLLIGDGRTCAYATIIVYPGAYLHVEDNADLEFFKIVGDTQDKQVFFIANKPIGAAAQKGVAPSISNLLVNDTILSAANIPVEICDLYTVTPAYGIANRDWGFCNVLAPLARIKLPNDTICVGECVLINFGSSLNDPIRELEVCRIDTILGMVYTSCFGTQQLKGGVLTAGYNEASDCYSTEQGIKIFPYCTYIDSANHWYKIRVTVKNHCNLQDTQTLYFYVGRKPNAIISLPDSACAGYGTVVANNLSNFNAESATWHVHVMDTGQYQENDENRSYYGGDWELYNMHYGDTFSFPNFNWIGGLKYVVNLTQSGHCGESISNWDTIEIQPGARILASAATIYSNPLGPSALQLQAFIGKASSFAWSPTTYLSDANSLNPIATPTDTITYILSATKDNCNSYDTLSIKLNTLAFAGFADTVCNEPVLLGTNFDASLFLAYQYYENPSAVWDIISEQLQSDSAFFDKLSLYFLNQFGKNALQSLQTYSSFLVGLNRNQFYEQTWYLNYFRDFHKQRNYQQAFDYFNKQIDLNNSLKNYIAANSMFTVAALETFIMLYNNECYLQNAVQMSSVWEKYSQNGSNWVSLSQWDNQIKMWDSVSVPTTYKITVIDNLSGKVEFDQVNIWSDQAIVPAFYVQFQTDSTLYFNNVSEPAKSTTIYTWNFGDGSSTSNQINPIHTFPYFDSSYVVCLTASNICGTYQYCDTLRVDSAGLIGYSKTTRQSPILAEGNNNSIGKNANTLSSQGFKVDGVKLNVFPNPFTNEVHFAYQISQEYLNAKMQIHDYLGKLLNEYPLTNSKGVITADMFELSAGLYTYQLILDGRLVQTGKLVKN